MILSPRLPLGIRNCRRGGKKNVRRLLKSFMLHCFTLFEFLIIITYYCFKSWEKGRPLPSVEMYSFSLTLLWVYSLLVVWTRITLQCVIPLHSEDDKLLTGTGLHVHPREPQSLSSWLSEVPHTGSSSDGGAVGQGLGGFRGQSLILTFLDSSAAVSTADQKSSGFLDTKPSSCWNLSVSLCLYAGRKATGG